MRNNKLQVDRLTIPEREYCFTSRNGYAKPAHTTEFFTNEGDNPQHVGVILTQRDGMIYTIEGNSNGVVAIRQYPTDDTGIMGYGILDWKR